MRLEPIYPFGEVLKKVDSLISQGVRVRETGLEPASSYEHMNLNHARLPIPPFPQKKKCGQGWIRTTEANSGRFTVCSLWPLGNLPTYEVFSVIQRMELAMGLEPATC